MLKKTAYVFIAIGLLLVLLLAAWMVFIVEFKINKNRSHAVVQGINPAALEKLLIAPYAGMHPRFTKRPPETFPFPVRIGEVGPVEALFSGPLQYPFLCGIARSGLGQPLVDNQQGYGIPIYAVTPAGVRSDKILGYSQDCLLPTQAAYFYKRQGSEGFYPLSEANNDIEQIKLAGKTLDFVVRVEVGTINRFLYAIAVLRGEHETLQQPQGDHWNKRLIYQFRGGVGVGHKQGHLSREKFLARREQQLRDGYAVVYSTANQTSNHYNIWLAEDTALRVKRQFVALYGEPQYTVGIGGSGGAIQQYLFGQNNPALLDAAIPLYSYPDMITQTINVLDCELAEYYFDVTDHANPRWLNWQNRSLIEGFNAVNGEYQHFSLVQKFFSLFDYGQWFDWHPGATECVQSWRSLGPLVYNPRYHNYQRYFAPELFAQIDWTHWDDLKQIYGTDAAGRARYTWDNVGVQYGLQSLRNGDISVAEFLDLNQKIGSWKHPNTMTAEHFWIYNGDYFPLQFSVWGEHNMQLQGEHSSESAPRREGDLAAIEAAYRSGMVFVGEIDIPIIDIRHYLDDELNMHHAVASFSARQRIIEARGTAAQQLIWMAAEPYLPIDRALQQIDHWLATKTPGAPFDLLAHKPSGLSDACFTSEGELIAMGDSVWDGPWNHVARPGVCQQRFPSYSTSRQLAGADISDSVFKCHLQPLTDALAAGVYGEIDMQAYLEQLQRIFPGGVCDYSAGDAGRPPDLLSH